MTDEQRIAWIDSATYEQLFSKWRFAPSGDPFFVGRVGDHYTNVMAKRREEVGPEKHTQTSKVLGW